MKDQADNVQDLSSIVGALTLKGTTGKIKCAKYPARCQAIAPGAHGVLIVDQAGWHTTPKQDVPDNITIVPLPAHSPELNPVENVWQFLRDNYLSNRDFDSYHAILDICCRAWNSLTDAPWRIMSIGYRDWAHDS